MNNSKGCNIILHMKVVNERFYFTQNEWWLEKIKELLVTLSVVRVVGHYELVGEGR